MASSQNPYYGQSSCPHSQVRPPSYCASWQINLSAFLAFGGILFGFVDT